MRTIEQRIQILEKKLRINEKNALQVYFSEHPEKIKEFGTNQGVSWRELATDLFARNNPILTSYNRLLSQFKNKYPECFDDAYYWLDSDLIKKIKSSTEPLEEFKKIFSHEYSKSPKDYDEFFYAFINDKNLLKLKELKKEAGNYSEIKFKQLSNQYGINPRELAFGFQEITRMQSSSYQKLKPVSYGLLKAITVVPSLLPSVIYRGFFMDGNKVKDQEKFLKQWAIGNTPKVKLGKPTSWSTSKSVAIEFMENQDKVKNAKDGYHVLIKIKNPTVDEVIADLRNFEFSRFWNQQEIIISPEVTRYTVEELIPYKGYNDPDNIYNGYQIKNSKPGAGGWGRDKNTLLMDIFNLSKYDISLDTKIDYKVIKDSTIGDLVKRKMLSHEFFDPDYKAQYFNVLLPMYKLITQGFIGRTKVYKVLNPASVILSSQLDFKTLSSPGSLLDKSFEGSGLLSKVPYANDAIIALLTKIDLVQNNINKFVFNVEFLEYQLLFSEKSPGEEIVKYLETKNPIFEDLFVKEVKRIESRFSTVKINIK